MCFQREVHEFPALPSDFTNRNPSPGDNKEATKLLGTISPFTVFFLSEDGEQPVIRVPDVNVAVNWDSTASPQFQAALSIPEIMCVSFL